MARYEINYQTLTKNYDLLEYLINLLDLKKQDLKPKGSSVIITIIDTDKIQQLQDIISGQVKIPEEYDANEIKLITENKKIWHYVLKPVALGIPLEAITQRLEEKGVVKDIKRMTYYNHETETRADANSVKVD